VRHVVPVSPFLFLVAAGVLVRMPGAVRLAVAIPTAYWSWCLAMYRDVEQGLGVLEAPIHISLGGLRLPWLETLQGMGYARSQAVALPLLAVFGVFVWFLWGVGRPMTADAPWFAVKSGRSTS
jgi:hypothetical protein